MADSKAGYVLCRAMLSDLRCMHGLDICHPLIFRKFVTIQLPPAPAQPFLIRLQPMQAERLRAQAAAAGLSQSTYVAHLVDAAGDETAMSEASSVAPSHGAEAAHPIEPRLAEAQTAEGEEGGRVDLRLRPADRRELDGRIASRGLSRARYVMRLLRSHLWGAPQFDAGELAALRAANRELTMVGINLNQIARAMNVDVVDRRPFELELLLPELRRAVAGLRDSVRSLIAANLHSWEGEP